MESRYYAPRTLKLAVLSVATIGFANVHWAYRNWKHLKARDKDTSWPWARALFTHLTLYHLGRNINWDAQRSDLPPVAVGWLSVGFFILMGVSGRLPPPFWMICTMAFLPLIPLNNLARRVNALAQMDSTPDDKFTTLNWVTIVLGLLLWGIIIFGMTHPDGG